MPLNPLRDLSEQWNADDDGSVVWSQAHHRLLAKPTLSVGPQDAGNGDVTTITAATYTVLKTDGVILSSAAGGAVVLTLPLAADVGKGFMLQIVKTEASANTVSVARAGTDTINGGAGNVVAGAASSINGKTVVSNGVTAWFVY